LLILALLVVLAAAHSAGPPTGPTLANPTDPYVCGTQDPLKTNNAGIHTNFAGTGGFSVVFTSGGMPNSSNQVMNWAGGVTFTTVGPFQFSGYMISVLPTGTNSSNMINNRFGWFGSPLDGTISEQICNNTGTGIVGTAVAQTEADTNKGALMVNSTTTYWWSVPWYPPAGMVNQSITFYATLMDALTGGMTYYTVNATLPYAATSVNTGMTSSPMAMTSSSTMSMTSSSTMSMTSSSTKATTSSSSSSGINAAPSAQASSSLLYLSFLFAVLSIFMFARGAALF